MRILSCGALAALSCVAFNTWAAAVYAGVGTTGLEVGLALPLAERFAARLELNTLDVSRNFTTSNVDYDAKLKFSMRAFTPDRKSVV